MLQLHLGGGGGLNSNNGCNNTSDSSSTIISTPAALDANSGESPIGPNSLSPTTTKQAKNLTSAARDNTAVFLHASSSNKTSALNPTAMISTSSSVGSGSNGSEVGLSTHRQSPLPSPSPPENALGFLKYDNELLYITEPCTIIGRNSSTSHVHFHVAENNLVSRQHFQVLHDAETCDLYVQCLSKNGIFVDDFLQRRNADPLKLAQSCHFRFPSTEIRIQFESFVKKANQPFISFSVGSSGVAAFNNGNNAVAVTADIVGSNVHNVAISSTASTDDSHHQQQAVSTHQQHEVLHHLEHHQAHQQDYHQPSLGVSNSGVNVGSVSNNACTSNVIYSPLKITIPKKEQKSPYLSPTGTISAANSCPASPRQGFQQNQGNFTTYATSSNIQNQELFQTPSTASYNHNEKPPYSYAQLIVQAISAAPDKQLTLSGIYSFIVKHYPYYRKETNKGWQNSIRHNLSLNRYFIKVARSQDEPGKGSFWRIDPDSGAKLIDHSYKKRRQRSSQGFRPSYGMPRSAPVSPSHIDNSRESSPLQDIVLQSAPGSPGMSLENRAGDTELIYNSQNTHQNNAINSHQYGSGSPYYVASNQNSAFGFVGSKQQGNNIAADSSSGVGALIALKRNHAIAAGANIHQQQQQVHQDIMYELPTDYSGSIVESDDEECCDSGGVSSTAAVNKRGKYMHEAL